MSDFKRFLAVREGSRKDQKILRNHAVLGLPEDRRGIRVLWMYPDVLNLHGGRGDLMAIAHFCCLMGLPCEIQRVDRLDEPIPFDRADLIWFPPGDLASMPDLNLALAPHRDAFAAFARRGGMVVAVASSGALTARRTVFRDGTESEGLGLLDMELHQRQTAFGDDLWIETEGLEVLATQVQMADVRLLEGQKPFARVIYGRGNDGSGFEGARTGGVIFTHCLGPVLTKNPRLAERLILRCASIAGLDVSGLRLTDEQVSLELAALRDVRTFVDKKRSGEIHWKK